MKRRLRAALLLITVAIASIALADKADVAQLAPRLQQTTDPSLCSIAQWEKMDPDNRHSYLIGCYVGQNIACILVNQGQPNPKIRPKFRYLLAGWNKPPSEYAPKVDADLRKTPKFTKSLAASIVRAEALFAKSAGQTARAQRLQLGAQWLEFYASIFESDKLLIIGGEVDQPKYWHSITARGLDSSYLHGVLDGVILERYALDADVRDDKLFLYGEDDLYKEMTSMDTSELQDKSMVYLCLTAQLALCDRGVAPLNKQ